MSEFDFDIDLFCEQLTDDWVLDETENKKEKEKDVSC